MKKILFLILIFVIKPSFSQNEANIWYFGYEAGIDFNTDPPEALTNSAMSQREGCASISDPGGNILFYTDGQVVFNRNHSVMSNGTGLNGGQSSTQSGIIIPMPGNPELYYIFTVPEEVNGDIKYSIVDLTLDNGLGAVTDVKNVYLVSPSMEKITGVRHANGMDVWLITHLWNSNTFVAFLIDEDGISSPVISNVGAYHSGLQGLSHGQMKVSPDGGKLAITARVINSFELFEFDNETGVVSNPITFPPNYNLVYGIDFSQDCSKLYISKYENGSNIYQFDLDAGSPQEIIDSEVLVGTVNNSHIGALQLAPDHKIYVAKTNATSGDNHLGVIHNPDAPGLDCNFEEDGFYLDGRKCVYGLPTFLQNYFLADFTFEPVCLGDTTYFEITNTNNIVSVLWDFGDPASGNNSSTMLNPFHIFSSAGIYTVVLTIEYPNNTHTATQEVTIHPAPEPFLGNDTVICGAQSILLDPGNNFYSYLWQDGSVDSSFLAAESGTYWVTVTNQFGCLATDSVNIDFSEGLDISIGSDSTLCSGDTLLLCAEPGYEQYLWQDGSSDSCFTATTSGIYWVQVTDELQCMAFDTVNLVFLPSADISFGPDTLICFNETLLLDPGAGFDNYLWQDGSQGQSFLVSEPGTYWVNVSNPCGEGGDTIQVDFTEPYDISLGNDTSFCYGQSIILDPGAGYSSYLWDDGATSQFNSISTHGYHWVEVTDSLGCIATDSIFVEVFNAFEITISDEDSIRICEGEYIFLNGPDGYESYLWQDGSDFLSILADTAGTYWLEVTDENGCAARDSVELIINIIPDTLLGNDTVICPGETLPITAKPGYEDYVWHNGSTGETFIAEHPGLYWVTVQDDIGCTGSDSINVSAFEIPGLGLAGQEWICPDDTLLLDAGEGYLSYLWNDGSVDPTLEVTGEGIYSVEVGTVCGTYSDAVEVEVYTGDMDLGNDTTLCSNEILVLNPGNAYSGYQWSTGSTDSIITVSGAGDYWLKAFDGFCMVSDTIIIDACAEIRIPNMFSPNSDGVNDTFYAETENESGILNFKMVILNRWGKVVHTLNHIDEQWNGRINNSEAAEGVYFWVCDYNARDRYGKINEHSQQGSVTLLRGQK